MTGTVYLVGAGPGALDLLTLRAARLLDAADIVFYDALVPAEIVALATRADKIAVGKRCGAHSTAQAFINKRLVDAAHKHAVVVRLKGGDPMLFGRAPEEIEALRAAGIAYEIVPGVSAAFAAAADAGISLTARGVSRSVAFVTPRVGVDEAPAAWTAPALAAETVAIYMGRGEAQAIAADLIAAGRDPQTPVAIVANASRSDRLIVRGALAQLGALATRAGDAPAVILIGAVVASSALAPAAVNQAEPTALHAAA